VGSWPWAGSGTSSTPWAYRLHESRLVVAARLIQRSVHELQLPDTVDRRFKASTTVPRECTTMGRIVVDVMPKPEILDPQGKAVLGALARLGFTEFAGARQGKRFELEVDGEVTDEVLAKARAAAETLLSNPVIEDVVAVTPAP
jgi:phosphoribosylformylglycinamidine synthase